MRILIADDEATSRIKLVRILEKGGHDVIVAVDGGDAWQRVQAEDAPHLLILDWMMPEMDGLEVVKRVRSLQMAIPAYVIMLTARNAKADIIAALATGADDMLTKPCDPGELLARVEVGRRLLQIQEKLIEQKEELRQTHAKLSHAQKLEGVGQLAAGIAHEINTPTQFISDSVHFLKEAFEDQQKLISKYREVVRASL